MAVYKVCLLNETVDRAERGKVLVFFYIFFFFFIYKSAGCRQSIFFTHIANKLFFSHTFGSKLFFGVNLANKLFFYEKTIPPQVLNGLPLRPTKIDSKVSSIILLQTFSSHGQAACMQWNVSIYKAAYMYSIPSIYIM